MAAQSNSGFQSTPGHYINHYGDMNLHAISYQSGAVSSLSEMVPTGGYFGLDNDSCGMMYSCGNSSIMNGSPVISQPGNASGSSLLLDSVSGLKHDAGLAVEWSIEEQFKLEEGLIRFANEPSMLRYIKIAATLRDKTVRDVALRCRWMTRKRRKSEENMVKKVFNRKDKPVESSSKQYLLSALAPTMATYSHLTHHVNKSQRIQYEDGIYGPVKRLLEQNAQAFSEITANLSTYKLQDNINLFSHTRHNISTILNDMTEMPGIMSQLPPLPVSIDEDLASSLLPKQT